jgi:hypothetical protein
MAVIFGRVIPNAFEDDTESESEEERNGTVMTYATPKTPSTRRVVPTNGFDGDTESESDDEGNDTGMYDSTKTLSTQFNTTVQPVKRKRSMEKPHKLTRKSQVRNKGVGIDARTGRWRASAQISRCKTVRLGTFDDEETAADVVETFLLDRFEKVVIALEESVKEDRITLTASRINEDAVAKVAVCEARKSFFALYNRKIFICETCHKTCFSQTDLRIHRVTHTTEKKFPCTACGKRFSSKPYLNTHSTKCGKV